MFQRRPWRRKAPELTPIPIGNNSETSHADGNSYGDSTRVLISEATNHLAADMRETREIDTVVVVGKTEPQRIFELLGRKGEVARERLALRDAYVEALDAYRRKEWEKAIAGFEDCLAIVPCDTPSKLSLERIAQFRVTAPCAEWNGVWSLVEK
jgi:adenylate cyclase